ncbi:MAG: hypothetical protein P4L53_28380 [Candidatus Obscuribacterales bacterium]|nr:hypothetical protein [Candidatus Obscuribacterales bacterium]
MSSAISKDDFGLLVATALIVPSPMLAAIAGDRWQKVNEYPVVFELIRPLSEEQLVRLAQN